MSCERWHYVSPGVHMMHFYGAGMFLEGISSRSGTSRHLTLDECNRVGEDEPVAPTAVEAACPRTRGWEGAVSVWNRVTATAPYKYRSHSAPQNSSRFSGTKPKVLRIVGCPKSPWFGSPVRLNASAPIPFLARHGTLRCSLTAGNCPGFTFFETQMKKAGEMPRKKGPV